MHLKVLIAVWIVELLSVLAFAQLPPGYELVDITNDNIRDRDPRMNDRGQIVFQAYMGPSVNDREIILYDNGEFVQLTDDDVPDGGPDINNDGVVVWLKPIGPDGPFGPTTEIMMYDDGVVTRLTDDSFVDSHPRINATGQVAWARRVGELCGAGLYDICLFTHQSIEQVTQNALIDGVSNQTAAINDHGDIVWTEYSFCEFPWTSRIMMYSDGVITQLSPPGQVEPQAVKVNNQGLVAWSDNNGVYFWEQGFVAQITEWGGSPMINNRGDMAITRWHVELQAYQGWLLRDGAWYQLTADPFVNNFPYDIDRSGQVVLQSGSGTLAEIRLVRRSRDADFDVRSPVPTQSTGVMPFP